MQCRCGARRHERTADRAHRPVVAHAIFQRRCGPPTLAGGRGCLSCILVMASPQQQVKKPGRRCRSRGLWLVKLRGCAFGIERSRSPGRRGELPPTCELDGRRPARQFVRRCIVAVVAYWQGDAALNLRNVRKFSASDRFANQTRPFAQACPPARWTTSRLNVSPTGSLHMHGLLRPEMPASRCARQSRSRAPFDDRSAGPAPSARSLVRCCAS
jgi:hypothetical protein